MKICILTQRLHINYGGILQAYALQIVLKRMGHEVVTDRHKAKPPISFVGKVARMFFNMYKRFLLKDKSSDPFLYFFKSMKKKIVIESPKKALSFSKFIDEHINTVDLFQGYPTPHKDKIKGYDVFVVGSDQVWRPSYSYVPTYFLEFTKDMSVKRIAYAASFGVDHCNEYDRTTLDRCRIAAKKFDAISVREDTGVELCKSFFDISAQHLLDPTLLLNQEDYLSLIHKEDLQIKKNMLLSYMLDKTSEKEMQIRLIANELKLSTTEIMLNNKIDASEMVFPSISKWLSCFRDAEFVVTDSFHGMVFSILFNKQFAVILNNKRGSARYISLLRIFHLENRIVREKSDLDNICKRRIDFIIVNSILSEWKDKSMFFLHSNI